MWSIHYKNVFQKCNLSGDSDMHIDKNVSKVDLNNDLFVSVTEIICVISDLPNGKSVGIDNLSSEHLNMLGICYPICCRYYSLVCSCMVICLLR